MSLMDTLIWLTVIYGIEVWRSFLLELDLSSSKRV